MIEWAQIHATVRNRQMANGVLLNNMIEVRRRYNADWVVPYVTEEDSAALPSTTPALIAEAIDFLGMRAASMMPYMNSPALDMRKDTGVRSQEYAGIRRKILGATHHRSHTKLHMRRAMRHMAGYATCSMVVVPDFDAKEPRLELRDPLTSYPETKAPEDLSPPANCAFVFAKSIDWLRDKYPQTRDFLPAQVGKVGEDMWDVVEWMDAECTVIGVLGPRNLDARQSSYLDAANNMMHSMELARWPHDLGMCPAYIPKRVTLDKIASQIANMTGQVDLMAQLQALAITASEKSIFKDRYIIGDGTKNPRLVGGVWKDGRTGEVNILQDAKTVGELSSTPDPQITQTIDRLERNVRVSTGLVAQAGGETMGALRTGRGMDSMMASAVDPRCQELQEIIEVGLEHINEAIFKTYKCYWGQREYTMFSGWPGDRGTVTFTPDVHIETTENVVAYTVAGADVQGTTIVLGQLAGMGGISRKTMRTKHPYIDDPDAEEKRVQTETLEDALLAGITKQAEMGALPVTQLARIESHLKDHTITQAVILADDELKKEQAAAQPPAPAPGAPADPSTMPGLAPPGAAPPAGTMGPPPQGGAPPEGGPPVPGEGEIGPSDNQAGLRQLMKALGQSAPPPGPPAGAMSAPGGS